MANLSQIKREQMLSFLEKLKAQHNDDDSLIALNQIEKELTSKKYGLVWEEHEENVDVMMQTHIPVFTEVPEKELVENNESNNYNFLIEGDNLHSVKLLEKTNKGKIDVIYIDPPYNTGKKDFVYDDTFVDDTDGFIHSKWLSFMYKRLLVAKNLLSDTGVMAISIGYQEVHNLMLLCQGLFQDKQVTCVTVQTSGGKPNGGFNYVQEYLIFVAPTDFMPNAMRFTGGVERSPFEGLTLSTFTKVSRPNQTYPIYVNRKTMNIVGVGKSLAERIKEGSYTGELSEFEYNFEEIDDAEIAILWPISSKGADCVWRLIPSRLLDDWKKGYIKVTKNKSKKNPNKYSIQYLPEGVIKKIEGGELEITGRVDGSPTLIFGKNQTVGSEIPTIWNEKDFFTTKGTTLVREIFGDNRFSYPKPLELVIEIMRAVSKKDSVILDFFAGSGTTGQAVLELNKEDNGNRRFIICTNNENDLCEKVTYQRIKTVMTGRREDGSYYSEGFSSNLKYYRTEFVGKDNLDMYDMLLEHIVEMIQLQYGIKIDGREYVVVMDDDEMDEFEREYNKYNDVKAVFINQEVLLSTSQEKLLEDLNVHIIPDCYFDFELREAGELW